MNDKISLYEVLDTSVTQVETTCDDCGKTQSDFDESLLDKAIPCSLDTPLIRNMILQSKQKVAATPHTEVLEFMASFPENTVHVIELPHIDPTAKLYVGKVNECVSGMLVCLLINGVYAGSYMTQYEDAEIYTSKILCDFEALINMLKAYDEDAYGELNLAVIDNLPVTEISGYIPLIARKFMEPHTTYENFSNTDYERFINWSRNLLNQKLVYAGFPDTHLVIVKRKGNNAGFYLAVKNNNDCYRTMKISLDNSKPAFIKLMLEMLSDDGDDIDLPDELSFNATIPRTIDNAAKHLEELLSNLDY